MTALVILILSVWFGLAVLCQVAHPLVRRIRGRDVLTLVPSWRFFAPSPSIVDLHLLVRDRLADGSFTAFEPVALPYQNGRWWWAWNPERRQRKIVFDAVRVVEGLAAALPSRAAIVTSVPYLMLLNFLIGLDHHPEATATQFIVVRTAESNRRDPRLVLRSGIHDLG